jgi:ATP-binding cassette subfamily F protein uup
VAPLLNAQGIAKSYGSDSLFENISVNIGEHDRLGMIGPNGSGKSTLLEILAGRREPDSGQVALRKGTKLQYVAQESRFEAGETIKSVIRRALDRANVPDAERGAVEGETLGRAGFEDFDAEALSLSGGWRKRLAIAEALAQDPAILLLDEPTNHLDLAGIEWLENLLRDGAFASVVVSHDRYFLQRVATRMMELSPAYPGGLLSVDAGYADFLEKKSDFLHAQAKRQETLENLVRTEIEWLRRGPKARATKAKARIDQAHEKIGELADIKARNRIATAGIDFTASERKTKRLLHLEHVTYGFEGRPLINDLDFSITAGMRVGLVGANGSGKTTLLRLLQGEIEPIRGDIQRAANLRTVYFDQTRKLDRGVTLRRALAPESDSVIYQDRVVHVASWAARFLFSSEQLNQPVDRLSGGERARVLIARLMLEPADLVLLDEPTNDLDIPTLEILEENLLDFSGALVLVTHDRYLLDRVSTVVLGLDGTGGVERFADYSQWESWIAERKQTKQKPAPAARQTPSPAKKKLSYLDTLEHETIVERIADAESELKSKYAALEDPAVVRDGRLVEAAYQEMEEAQRKLDALYARWSELEDEVQS